MRAWLFIGKLVVEATTKRSSLTPTYFPASKSQTWPKPPLLPLSFRQQPQAVALSSHSDCPLLCRHRRGSCWNSAVLDLHCLAPGWFLPALIRCNWSLHYLQPCNYPDLHDSTPIPGELPGCRGWRHRHGSHHSQSPGWCTSTAGIEYALTGCHQHFDLRCCILTL